MTNLLNGFEGLCGNEMLNIVDNILDSFKEFGYKKVRNGVYDIHIVTDDDMEFNIDFMINGEEFEMVLHHDEKSFRICSLPNHNIAVSEIGGDIYREIDLKEFLPVA